MYLPSSVEPIFLKLSVAFTQPTAVCMAALVVGMILSRGRHTITAALRMLGTLATGHFSSYHRVFSRAAWSPWVLSRTLTQMVLDLFPRGQIVPVAVDETTAGHKGPKVYGKGCHRDAVRSTHTHVTYKWGHKWVVLAIVVKFPFAKQPWSLPGMATLYRPEKLNRAEHRRHKTPSELARQMLAVLIHWFPERTFTLLGDGGYATAELADFCSRHGHPLVSRLRSDATLFASPPPRRTGQTGRPRIVGLFTRRWSIELTFQEVRAHLGFETPRQRVKASVLRTAPCILGFFTVVSLVFAAHARRHRVHPATTAWYTKADIASSDALAGVRRLLWTQTVLSRSRYAEEYTKLLLGLKRFILDHLCAAA